MTITPLPSLDLTRNDDQIVAEALAFQSTCQADNVSLLTADTGPMLTARHHNLPCVAVPEDWLLDPEPDERDKKIHTLERQVVVLQQTRPLVAITALLQNQQVTRVEEKVLKYEALSTSTIEHLTTKAALQYPMPDEFRISDTELTMLRMSAAARGRRLTYVEPTNDEITKYREERYPAWLASVKAALTQAATDLNDRAHHFPVTFQITNSGNVPANNAILEVRVKGDVYIAAPAKEAKEEGPVTLHLPTPPDPPSGQLTETVTVAGYPDISSRYNLDALQPPPVSLAGWTRDRNAFYWDERSHTATTLLRLSCEEFRHQDEPQELEITVVAQHGRESAGLITCRLSATNLPEPEELTIPIKTIPTLADTEALASNLIRQLPRKPSRTRTIKTV
jgi:hypothetical protein